MPLNEAAASGVSGVIYAENGSSSSSSRHKSMTNSSKADVMGGGSGGAALQLGLSLTTLQGQKWQQIFDLDKVIKQLRTAEKTYLRGGQKAATQAAVQVQRLNASDMGYYDIVPKLACRDVVVCNSCSGSYTKAGFHNHMALQHPTIWDATSNKVSVNHTVNDSHRLTANSSSSTTEHIAPDAAAADPTAATTTGSPMEMSTSSNGSSSSASLLAASSSSSSSVSASSSSSSRHKSSSKSSSSSSKGSSGSSSTGGGGSGAGSSSGTSSRSRSKSSKNRHHTSPAPALDLNHKEKSGSKKSSSSNSSGGNSSSSAIAAPPAATTATAPPTAAAAAAVTSIKEEPLPAVPASITVFSSSSNSSCSLPTTPTLTAANPAGQLLPDNGVLSVNYSPANPQQLEDKPEVQPKKKLKGSSDHRTKAAKEKQPTSVNLVVANSYEPQQPPQQQQQQQQVLSELDQAVSSITEATIEEAIVPEDEGEEEEAELPLPNTSADNSISLNLDEMFDSKLLTDILKSFDESTLDTSQAQQQQQQQQQQVSLPQATKRLRFDEPSPTDGTSEVAVNEDYVSYQEQSQQQQQQVYNEDNQSQLTAIDAMQLQQLIYQQQQMLEQNEPQGVKQEQQQQEELVNRQDNGQFSVYNVPSLTDPAQQLDEHMMLPSIIYEITESNQVSVLDQQSQQQVIAEFLTQAGYENVMQEQQVAAVATGAAGTDLNEELNDFDFSKLETTKTVKLEATTNNHNHHQSLINAKYHEDAYFNVMLYTSAPRPLAMNTFGLVKLPNGLGTTLRKNLLTTRKANNSLLSLNGSSGVVGQLARTPPPIPPSSSSSNAASSNNLSNGHGLLARNPYQGKTIYAQKSSVIAQERVRCQKRSLMMNGKSLNGGQITAKKLNDLLMGKLKKEDEEAAAAAANESKHKEDIDKLTFSFYEKRRKLLAKSQQLPTAAAAVHLYQRQRSLNLPLPRQNHASSPQQLLKKQLMRTLSDSSNIVAISHNNNNNIINTPNNSWKSQSSTTPGSSSTPTSSDLMRVFV